MSRRALLACTLIACASPKPVATTVSSPDDTAFAGLAVHQYTSFRAIEDAG